MGQSSGKNRGKSSSGSKPCSDEVFRKVSGSIGKDARDLGRALGIGEESVASSEKDESKCGLEQVACNTLNRWQRLQGNNATEEDLSSALIEIGRTDIVEKLGFTDIISKKKHNNPDTSSPDSSLSETTGNNPGTKISVGTNNGLAAGLMTVGTVNFNQTIIQADPKQTTIVQQETGKPVGFAGDDSSLTLEQLKAKLRKKYKTLRMKGLPWMKDLRLSLKNHYVSLEMVKKGMDRPNANDVETDSNSDEETNAGNEGSKHVELDEIFPPSSNRNRSFGKQRSCNILVEGDAGFGKTTLASKLCYDYSNGKNYMQQFDVVLLFPLRNFDGNVDEMICKAAFGTKEQLSSLSEIINSESVQTVIILDGFDELAQKHVNSILPLIRGEILPHVTLVVTSRTGRFTEKNADTTTDVEFDMEPLWDCQYKLIGLNKKRQDEFVERHLKNFSPDKKRRLEVEMKEMKKKKIIAAEFLKCPLFFLMVFLLLSENLQQDLQRIRTMTELYKEVFNFVMRRYLTKRCAPNASKADLFSFDNANRPFYINLIAKLGEISLSEIKTEQVCFSQEMISELNPEIFKIGILTQTLLVEGLKEVVYYEAVHKSLIEFAAAYSLLISFSDGPRDQWNKTIVKLRPTYDSFTSLVLPFLAGLMGNEAGTLFEAIQSHYDGYSNDDKFHILSSTLRELQMNDLLMPALIHFLPSEWKTHWEQSDISSSSLPPEIMLHGLKVGQIKRIYWDLHYPVCFTEDIKVAELRLMLLEKMNPLNENQVKLIECQSLTCVIVNTLSEQESKALFSLVSSIYFQHISFDLKSPFLTQFLPLLYESLINGHLNQTNIHKIECLVDQQEGTGNLDLLIDLIKRERIESLNIEFYFSPSQQQLQTLSESIAKSSRFIEFALNCEEETCLLAVELVKSHIQNKICRVYNRTIQKTIYSS